MALACVSRQAIPAVFGLLMTHQQHRWTMVSQSSCPLHPTSSSFDEQAFFRPELLNRLDEVVCFRPLDAAAATSVTRLLAADTPARLLERQIRLDVAPDLIDHIATAACDKVWPTLPTH